MMKLWARVLVVGLAAATAGCLGAFQGADLLPPAPVGVDATVVVTCGGQPVAQAQIAFSPHPSWTTNTRETDAAGHATVTLLSNDQQVELAVHATGCSAVDQVFPFNAGTDTPPQVWQQIALDKTAATHVLASNRLVLRGNFANLFDGAGRPIFTDLLEGAPSDVEADWLQRLAAAGTLHLFVGPPLTTSQVSYPGAAWPLPASWSDLAGFRRYIERLLDAPSADGRGFTPVLFVGADRFADAQIDRWPELAAALDGLRQYLWVVPCWECIPSSGWTSAQFSQALLELHRDFPESVLAVHFAPGRWTGSSNPIEADDPWQGDEIGFYLSSGGQYVQEVLYQAPHQGNQVGDYRLIQGPHWIDCDEDASPTTGPNCWLNRWQDGVERLGTGGHNWPQRHIAAAEVTAFESFRGQVTPEQARLAADLAKRICDKWQVVCGYGNGLPH